MNGNYRISAAALLLTGIALSAQAPSRAPAQDAQPRAYPKVNAAVGYEFVSNWPKVPAGTTWGQMSSVSIDSAGNVWTLNRGKVPIQVYRSDGTFMKMWGEGLFKTPHSIRFDRQGNLWAADMGNHTVTKFRQDGMLLMTLGTKDEAGNDERHFNQPTDVAVTPAGEIFVSDGYGNARIVHYDKNGRFVKAWGQLGSQSGEFSIPHNIVVDSKGLLYICDRQNVRIQVFDQNGKYITEWRDIITPWAAWITPQDELYVVGTTPTQWREATGVFLSVPVKDQIMMRFDTDGRVRQTWAFPKGAERGEGQVLPGQMNMVHTIAVAANGDVYLGDVVGNRAQKFRRIAPDVSLGPRHAAGHD